MSVAVVVLCEDAPQGYFLRHALLRLGIHKQKIRLKECPKGEQSGEQYVRESLPLELQRLRRYQGRAYLVVVQRPELARLRAFLRV